MLKMKKLIATLGIPLSEAEQSFKFLNGETKKTFPTKFSSACNKMKLPDISVDSFSYYLDFKYQFDAFDLANLMAAVLNNAKNLKDLVFKVESGMHAVASHSTHFNSEQNFWSVFHQLLER